MKNLIIGVLAIVLLCMGAMLIYNLPGWWGLSGIVVQGAGGWLVGILAAKANANE